MLMQQNRKSPVLYSQLVQFGRLFRNQSKQFQMWRPVPADVLKRVRAFFQYQGQLCLRLVPTESIGPFDRSYDSLAPRICFRQQNRDRKQ